MGILGCLDRNLAFWSALKFNKLVQLKIVVLTKFSRIFLFSLSVMGHIDLNTMIYGHIVLYSLVSPKIDEQYDTPGICSYNIVLFICDTNYFVYGHSRSFPIILLHIYSIILDVGKYFLAFTYFSRYFEMLIVSNIHLYICYIHTFVMCLYAYICMRISLYVDGLGSHRRRIIYQELDSQKGRGSIHDDVLALRKQIDQI